MMQDILCIANQPPKSVTNQCNDSQPKRDKIPARRVALIKAHLCLKLAHLASNL